jgi:hypothetical protein
MLFLSSCSNPLGALIGGGPNIAANGQAGRTNSQTLGTTEVYSNQVETEGGSTVRIDQVPAEVKADNVETVNITDTNIWLIILLVLGWLLPSPNEIARSTISIFTWRKGRG